MGEQTPRKKKSTLTLYIVSAFVLTAAMTVLVVAGAIIVVWNADRASPLDESDLYTALLVGGLVALVVAVVLGAAFASGVAQPVSRISKTASKLKDGDLSARTGLHGDDEIASLGETFDEMADSIERDRDLERQLIGDVAHELRTPLMAIQATVEAIQDGVFEADEKHLGTISSETRRLGRLVEALLHLNRLENGTIVAEENHVDLTKLVKEIAESHEALVESSGLSFTSDVEEDVRVEGDADLLTQAIANLLSNAVRYTPEGGSVALRLYREGGDAVVSVSDTGIGISEDDLDKVFSRFWRADSARSSVSGGLGIGLSLVKEVADQHRGDVGVESSLGEGSTFTMSIPLSSDDLSLEPSSQRESRRQARAARKESDKQRKEEEKVKKLQERQLKQQQRSQERAKKQEERSSQQRSFGRIHVSLPSRKDDDEKSDS